MADFRLKEGKYKISLEHIVPTVKKVIKNDGHMLKNIGANLSPQGHHKIMIIMDYNLLNKIVFMSLSDKIFLKKNYREKKRRLFLKAELLGLNIENDESRKCHLANSTVITIGENHQRILDLVSESVAESKILKL